MCLLKKIPLVGFTKLPGDLEFNDFPFQLLVLFLPLVKAYLWCEEVDVSCLFYHQMSWCYCQVYLWMCSWLHRCWLLNQHQRMRLNPLSEWGWLSRRGKWLGCVKHELVYQGWYQNRMRETKTEIKEIQHIFHTILTEHSLFIWWLQVNGYTCVCTAGWTGMHCESNIEECSSNPCDNNATCEDGVATYTCQCLSGFTGQFTSL